MNKIEVVSFENKKIRIEVYNEPLWGYTVNAVKLNSGNKIESVHERLEDALDAFNELLAYEVR